jgi:hypothetical protein
LWRAYSSIMRRNTQRTDTRRPPSSIGNSSSRLA